MMPFLNIADIGALTGFEFESQCRSFSSYAPLHGTVGLARILSRYKIFVDTQDLSLTPHLIMDGFWESWVSQCMARIVRPGDHCIDVGANLGYYSVLMSALSEGAGRTLAVEPSPKTCELLRQTAEVNTPGFRVVEEAASDRNGFMELNVPLSHLGDASLLARQDRIHEQSEKIEVSVATLDYMVAREKWEKVDVVKIDAEGAEPLVFDGMKEILAGNEDLKIILEYSPFLYPHPVLFTEMLFDRFDLYRIGAGTELVKAEREQTEALVTVASHLDLLLLKKGSERPY